METLTGTLEEDVFDSKSLDNETEFKTLVRSIKLSDGFSLFFARANEISTQAELIRNLESEFSEKEIKIIFFRYPTKHLLDNLKKILSNQKPFAVLIYGLNDSFPTKPNSPKNTFIKNLNASRNSFPKVIDCPLVLFVPDFAITAIMRGATDFFSVRSGVFYFESQKDNKESQIGEILSASNYEIGSLTIEERKERIKTIQDLLKDEKDRERQIRLHLRLGELNLYSGNYKKAETEFNLALALSKQLNNLEIESKIYNNLAVLYREQGKYEEAIKLYQEALLIDKKTIGKEHPDFASLLNNLANVYKIQCKYEEAKKLYQEALLIDEKTVGKEHPQYSTHLSNLAGIYRSMRNYEEALRLYQEALIIGEKTFGKSHPEYATYLNNLANVYASQGKYDEAIQLYKEVLIMGERMIGKGHPYYASRLNNLANVYENQGKYQDALDLFEEALKINEKTLPENHPYTIQDRESVARCRAKLGK